MNQTTKKSDKWLHWLMCNGEASPWRWQWSAKWTHQSYLHFKWSLWGKAPQDYSPIIHKLPLLFIFFFKQKASTRPQEGSVCAHWWTFIADQLKVSNSLGSEISSLITHKATLFIAQSFNMQIYQSKNTVSLALEVSHLILKICDGYLQGHI